jgi:hypothetical protein
MPPGPAPDIPEPWTGSVRGTAGVLFAAVPERASRSRGWWIAGLAAEVAAVALSSSLMLLRVPEMAPWQTMYNDDYGTFWREALQHPWHLLIPTRGYVQVLPHLIAQLVAYLPLVRAAEAMAGAGVLLGGLSALVVYRVSAAHVRCVPLRLLLASAVVLLPVAPLETIATTVAGPWFMLLALFWVILWRPRTAAGMALAAVLAFLTATSTVVVVCFAPLFALRLYALRRPREHAVTAGWLAGCLVQVPFVVSTYLGGVPNLGTQRSPDPLGFFARDVILPAFGWHLSFWIQSLAGRNGGAVIVGVVILLTLGLGMAAAPGIRVLLPAMLATCVISAFFSAIVSPYPSLPPAVTLAVERGSRYTMLPIFLIEAAVIVALDQLLRQRARSAGAASRPGRARPQLKTAAAALSAALLLALAISWIPDFRYPTINRQVGTTGSWYAVTAKFRRDCEFSRTGLIKEHAIRGYLPCKSLRF